MEIEQEPQPGRFDAHRQRKRIGEVVDVVVGIRLRLGRAAGEEPQAHAVDPLIPQDTERILRLAVEPIIDAAFFKEPEVRQVGPGEKIAGRVRRVGKGATCPSQDQREQQEHSPVTLGTNIGLPVGGHRNDFTPPATRR
jgi:hypothetical protein